MHRIQPLMDENALSTGAGRRQLLSEMRRLNEIVGSVNVEFKDYYATLGVTKGSTEKEIKQAFRKLARKHHPDVNPGDKAAESKFKEINEAYEVLGDAAKRKNYDELGANWRAYEQAERAGGPNPFAGQWNANTGGGSAGGGFRTMTQEEMEEMFGDQNPFSDFFTTFFGGGGFGQRESSARGGSRARARQRPGRDVEHEHRAVARGCLQRRHPPALAQTRRACTDGGRPHPRRRRRRVARQRLPAKANPGPAARRLEICICACGWRRIHSSSARDAIST